MTNMVRQLQTTLCCKIRLLAAAWFRGTRQVSEDQAAGGDTDLQDKIAHAEPLVQHVAQIGVDECTFREDLADVCRGVAGLQTTLSDIERNQVGTKMDANFSRGDIADIMAVLEPFSGEDGIPVKLWIEEFETACAVLGVPLNRYWLYARRPS